MPQQSAQLRHQFNLCPQHDWVTGKAEDTVGTVPAGAAGLGIETGA